jgi:hypothetical protein
MQFDYVTLSLSEICLCSILFEWKLIMLLNFQSLRLYYIFCIIHHVVNICGVSVGFTSPSEAMCHPFGNNAPHIKL